MKNKLHISKYIFYRHNFSELYVLYTINNSSGRVIDRNYQNKLIIRKG